MVEYEITIKIVYEVDGKITRKKLDDAIAYRFNPSDLCIGSEEVEGSDKYLLITENVQIMKIKKIHGKLVD